MLLYYLGYYDIVVLSQWFQLYCSDFLIIWTVWYSTLAMPHPITVYKTGFGVHAVLVLNATILFIYNSITNVLFCYSDFGITDIFMSIPFELQS